MASGASRAIVVLATAGDEQQATRIARALVSERLAACVNVIGPIRSIYRWRGAIEDQAEYLLTVKTRTSLYPALERRVKDLHSYEVPELIALGWQAGSADYLSWLLESTRPSPAPKRIRGARRGRSR